MDMQIINHNGWENCLYLQNGTMELVITTDVGPRVIHCGFKGQPNLFAEIKGQQGGRNESEWMIRGGHRLWIAPEIKPQTYELDNDSVAWEEIPGGVRLSRPAGELTGIAKQMEVTLARDENKVCVTHTLKNAGTEAVQVAPWALTVMAPGGLLVAPLPAKTSHGAGDRFIPNQTWSIWPCTDLADGRWRIGYRYLFFRQRTDRGAGKLGLAQREGWTAYQLPHGVFVKRFEWLDGATYPDGNVNFETFANEDFLEVETLGPLVFIAPGAAVSHTEKWELLSPLPEFDSEETVDRHLLPLLEKSGCSGTLSNNK